MCAVISFITVQTNDWPAPLWPPLPPPRVHVHFAMDAMYTHRSHFYMCAHRVPRAIDLRSLIHNTFSESCFAPSVETRSSETFSIRHIVQVPGSPPDAVHQVVAAPPLDRVAGRRRGGGPRAAAPPAAKLPTVTVEAAWGAAGVQQRQRRASICNRQAVMRHWSFGPTGGCRCRHAVCVSSKGHPTLMMSQRPLLRMIKFDRCILCTTFDSLR